MLNLINLLVLVPVLSITSMIYGWGVEPKSWPVILGMYYLLIFVSLVCSFLDEQ